MHQSFLHTANGQEGFTKVHMTVQILQMSGLCVGSVCLDIIALLNDTVCFFKCEISKWTKSLCGMLGHANFAAPQD